MPRLSTLVLAASVVHAAGASVNMLQTMVSKMEAEGKTQEELFGKFMCYCKNGNGSLQKAVADAEDKAPKMAKAIEQLGAGVRQLQADLDTAKKDRTEAQAAVKEAKQLRAKQAGLYAKTSGDFTTNIAAMGTAITALDQGMGGSFLQSSTASLLKKIAMTSEMNENDRERFTGFLSVGMDHTYAPRSGEITSILKQMKETMEGDLAEARGKEAVAIEQFDGLVASKSKLIQGFGAEIEKISASGRCWCRPRLIES